MAQEDDTKNSEYHLYRSKKVDANPRNEYVLPEAVRLKELASSNPQQQGA
jgi:hypothetical protein